MTTTKRTPNPAAKTRPQSNPYEVWIAPGFEWRVLKKYKGPEAEARDPYARWLMATKGPGTFGTYELGDGYARDVKQHATLIYRDPAVGIPVGSLTPTGDAIPSLVARLSDGFKTFEV